MATDAVAALRGTLIPAKNAALRDGYLRYRNPKNLNPKNIMGGTVMKHWINHSLAAATLVAGLGLSTAFAQTPVTFQLNWTAGGPNAGFAAAVGEGYYKAAGLDVTIVQGNGSGNTAQLVASGRSQLAYADAVAIAQLVAKGAPMKVVSTLYQSNPNAVNTLQKTGIKSIAELIAYISTFMTLKPGDIIVTGTPVKTAPRTDPPTWLKAGDTVEISVPEIGTLRNTVVAES